MSALCLARIAGLRNVRTRPALARERIGPPRGSSCHSRPVSDTEGLYAAHQDGVFRYLRRAVGHAEAARDLTQEVFLRAVRSAQPVAPDERRAWIFTIARHLALNHLRDSSRQPSVLPLTEGARPPSQETAAVLNQAIGSLPDLDRDVFLMREVGGLTYDEIASACAVTPDAVRSRLHRVRVDLRAQLVDSLQTRRTHGIRFRTGKSPHDL